MRETLTMTYGYYVANSRRLCYDNYMSRQPPRVISGIDVDDLFGLKSVCFLDELIDYFKDVFIIFDVCLSVPLKKYVNITIPVAQSRYGICACSVK